jgi:hypothetical protein
MAAPPIAVGLTLCDHVIIEERTRKVSLIGTFTGLRVSDFPAVAPPFSVFALLTDWAGDATIELSVLELDTEAEVLILRNRVHFPDKLAEVRYHARLRQCTFPGAGTYQFTLLADGEWVAQRRLRLYSSEDQP